MRWAIFAVWFVAAATTGHSQSAPHPAFEVASVKLNNAGPNSPQRIAFNPGDRVSFTNVVLRSIIETAYDTAELVGGPDWIGKQGQPNWDADRFDIAAKAPSAASRDELRAMLRTLLAERFKLVVHSERRPQPVWALVLARRDGKLGPNLHPAKASCAELRAAWKPTTPGEPDPCGTRSFATALVTGRMSVKGFAIDQLSVVANDAGRRPVVNNTGLSGFFDWDLTWTPQRFLQGSFDRERFQDINPDGPSIFTALDEQLGLKLQDQKADLPVLVIDHAERPSEN